MPELKNTSALVLSSFPYKDDLVILSLYTEHFGKLDALSRIYPNKPAKNLSPLTFIECTPLPTKGELHKLKETHTTDALHLLRQDYDKLQYGLKILKLLSHTQMKDRPTPALFLLTKHLLAKMAGSQKPLPLFLCFTLKLLLHEGTLPIETSDLPLPLTKEEKRSYYDLSTSKNLKEIEEHLLPPLFEEKIDKISEILLF